MLPRTLGPLFAIAGLLFVLDIGPADAGTAAYGKHEVGRAQSKSAKPTGHTQFNAVGNKSANLKSRRKAVARKISLPAPSLAITTKAPNDAPDFDYTDRIKEAQDLIAKQPVQIGDMVADSSGNLSRFTWVLAVGKKTGPLTVVRMDQRGHNDKGLAASRAAMRAISSFSASFISF